MKKSYKQGFTLIELSIVLVIIAVIIGGILIGKTLVDSSKLQTVITDVDSYTAAVGNFKQAYQSLPGDFSNATAIWGSDSNTCPTGGGTSGTCSGNGDGQLVNTGSIGQAGETFLFWQHLNKAGMFNQSLSNQSGSGGVYSSVIGTNVPAGSIKGSGFSVAWYGVVAANGNTCNSTTSADCFQGSYGNVIVFGAASIPLASAVASDATYNPIITSEQAQYIDTKIDDGSPTTGKVRSYSNSCTNGNIYSVSTSGNICSLIFVMGF